MLIQDQADGLLAILKKLIDKGTIRFPASYSAIVLKAGDVDEREEFLIDVNRKGRIKITKCTYQERYQSVEVLLRLDVDDPPHENPDGEEVLCPHLHSYREGFGTKWAVPIPREVFTDPMDLVRTLRGFLRYCNIAEIPQIQPGAF